DRRLTPPQLLGRAGDRARLGHGGQSLQLTKIEHAPILRRPNPALHMVYGANQRSGGFPRPLPSVTMALCSNRFWTHRTASDTVASNSIRIRLPMLRPSVHWRPAIRPDSWSPAPAARTPAPASS